MSAPYYAGQTSASDSPYRPGTADSSWEQVETSTMAETRPDLYAHMTSVTTSSQLRPEPLQPTQQSAMGGPPMGVYLGPNVVTPRQNAFPRDQVANSSQYRTTGAMDGFDHGSQGVIPADTPRAAHFGGSSAFDASKMSVGAQHTFGSATSSTWPATMQQQPDTMPYNRYAYPSQIGAGSWSTTGGMSMSQNVIYDTSSSANTSPNRSQTYYDMPSDHMDHGGYAPHMVSHTGTMYGHATSKLGGSSAYMSASQSEYQPEEIDSMLNQVSTLYKTANTKKMAEFYRDKWARMWLTCNYTLKPSIQISIPRTILHESYRRACDSFGLEPLQAASFGKVLRSQFPDVAQRRLGGRGKTRFHYCGFGTSNEREAIKVKSLLEDEKAGKLQLSAGLSAEYASEARAKARSEGHEGETSYRTQAPSEASPVDGHSSRLAQQSHSPHAASERSAPSNTGFATDDRLIASAFATLNSAVLTPPGTSSGTPYSSQDAARYSQMQTQDQSHAAQASNSGGGAMPRRHTVSHSYSGLSDLSFLPGVHSAGETGDVGGVHSSDVSGFGPGSVSGISESAQSASLLNSPASSLHGYQYIQDPRHVPSSMPFRRSCQDLPDWPTLPDHSASSVSTTYAAASSTGNPASQDASRKAWREYESLCQALLYSIYLGPDPVSFEQRIISFWNSLTKTTRESLRSDVVLHGMILRADAIIFQQLLTKLDGMLGDDVADERMPGLKSLAKMLAEQIEGMVRDTLPEACTVKKVRASQKMSESLGLVIKIFEAIKTFREDSLLDVTADHQGGSHGFDADHSSLAASQGHWASASVVGTPSSLSFGLRNPTLASTLRVGNRPRSGTQTSLGSLSGPLANFQLRRRDRSVSSTLSDSLSTWAGGDAHPRISSSASESEVSSNIDGMPNNFYAPLARKATRSRMASDTSGGISHTFGSLALAMPQNIMHGSPQQIQGGGNLDSRPGSSAAVPPGSSNWGQLKAEVQE